MENFIKKGILGKDGGFDNYSKRPRIGGRQGDTVRCSFEPTGADASSSFFSIIAFLGNTPKGEADPSKDHAERESLSTSRTLRKTKTLVQAAFAHSPS